MAIFDFLGDLVKPITELIDNLTTTDEEKAQLNNALVSIENTMKSKVIDYETKLAEYQSKVIIAEAKGKSWLQRNWRPSLMAIFGLIVFNNYILAPYLGAMFNWSVVLPLPDQLWDLLKIGVGGYIIGRSGEKITKIYKSNGQSSDV